MFNEGIMCEEFVDNQMQVDHDFLDFSDLQGSLDIKSKELLRLYLKEVYKDIAEMDVSGKRKGISKIAFFEFLKIPIFICESTFKAFDINKDGYLTLSELTEGFALLYLGNLEDVVRLIFNIYDSDQDGIIHTEDLRLILSYLPLKEDCTVTAYKHQMNSQDEILSIVNGTFADCESLNYESYLKVIESQKSDSFLQLLCYLYEKRVFKPENLHLLEKNKGLKEKVPKPVVSIQSSNSLKLNEFYSPQPKRRIPSPAKASYLSPANQFLRRKSEMKNIDSLIQLFSVNKEDPETFNLDMEFCPPKDPETSAYEGMIRLHNLKFSNQGEDVNSVIELSTSGFDSPTNFLRKINSKMEDFPMPSSATKSCGNVLDQSKKVKRDRSFDTLPPMEGWIYKITETKKLKKYWLVIKNEDIFYYKNEFKEDLLGMHNLSGCSIKEAQPTAFMDQKFYTFVINFQTKNRNYYCNDRDQCFGWITRLRKAIGYECFFDHYEIIDDIGKGKFGVVKLGVHKNTQLKVAIKTIRKENIKTKQDQELVKVEIDIMKLCRHPNIVNLLDHFENSDYIFIVMEYIQGGDLTRYVRNYYKGSNNNRILPEARVAELMKQLARGLQYLHSYGIIHRDLKPDNIMMTDRTSTAEIKIMDFGLSKMMHHGEKVADGYGTLSFVAPEVLLRKPYNSKVDVWSLGVTIYYLLSGELPFDHSKDDDSIIAKKVVFAPIEFKSKIWNMISQGAKTVISGCLTKDQDKRISITDFLDSAWINASQ